MINWQNVGILKSSDDEEMISIWLNIIIVNAKELHLKL